VNDILSASYLNPFKVSSDGWMLDMGVQPYEGGRAAYMSDIHPSLYQELIGCQASCVTSHNQYVYGHDRGLYNLMAVEIGA
jgi:hypothetical protein